MGSGWGMCCSSLGGAECACPGLFRRVPRLEEAGKIAKDHGNIAMEFEELPNDWVVPRAPFAENYVQGRQELHLHFGWVEKPENQGSCVRLKRRSLEGVLELEVGVGLVMPDSYHINLQDRDVEILVFVRDIERVQ